MTGNFVFRSKLTHRGRRLGKMMYRVNVLIQITNVRGDGECFVHVLSAGTVTHLICKIHPW